jgi:hypothetical protein
VPEGKTAGRKTDTEIEELTEITEERRKEKKRKKVI